MSKNHFDSRGNHWHRHGEPVHPLTIRGHASPAMLTVFSQLEHRLTPECQVIAHVAEATTVTTLRLTAKDARVLAKALLAGADTADKVDTLRAARAK